GLRSHEALPAQRRAPSGAPPQPRDVHDPAILPPPCHKSVAGIGRNSPRLTSLAARARALIPPGFQRRKVVKTATDSSLLASHANFPLFMRFPRPAPTVAGASAMLHRSRIQH